MAVVLWVTLRGVVSQAKSMTEQSQSVAHLLEETGKQAALTAEVLADQRRQRTLDIALRFHNEFHERNAAIATLTHELPAMPVDSRVEDEYMNKVRAQINWLSGYGAVCRAELVPEPDAVFGPIKGNLQRLLVACAYNVDHARARESGAWVAFPGLRWFEKYLDVDIQDESRKAQTVHPPRPEGATE